MPCSPEAHPVPTAASPAAVVEGNPTLSVPERISASTGASAAWLSNNSAPRPSTNNTQAPITGPGNAIGALKSATPIAARTEGATSARCGMSLCGRGSFTETPRWGGPSAGKRLWRKSPPQVGVSGVVPVPGDASLEASAERNQPREDSDPICTALQRLGRGLPHRGSVMSVEEGLADLAASGWS